MNINEMKIKDVSEETLRNYLNKLDKKSSLILSNDLKVTHYQNGDPIPLAVSDDQWVEFGEAKIGAYSINKVGDYLYNWYVVDDDRGICPEGWHVPSDEEWNKLNDQLRENPSYNDYRGYDNGNYYNMGTYGNFWSSTVFDDDNAWYRRLHYNNSEVSRHYLNKRLGFSVRYVREK